MALTAFQRHICQLTARRRIESGESYVAGAAALNALAAGQRISRDIDLFHDRGEAVAASFEADRALLERHGCAVRVERDRPGYVEAWVEKGGDIAAVQWAADSAYRYFPLITHDDFGLTLHPLDLATNKVLALVGRVEVRDWVDTIHCDDSIQRLGYLAWAAPGKDPAFSPLSILAHAARTTRYSTAELDALAFEGPRPAADRLALRWREMLDEANRLIEAMPAVESGKCVLGRDGLPFRGDVLELAAALRAKTIVFHAGSIRGALPQLRGV